jgi:hypothetical protein
MVGLKTATATAKATANTKSNCNCNCNCNCKSKSEIRGFFATLRMTGVGGGFENCNATAK